MSATQPPQTCRALRVDGRPCTGRARADSFCFAHSPELQEKRRAAYAEGGRNKATPQRLAKLMPADLKPVLSRLFTALEEVHDGELDPRQATAMASLASAIGRLYETAELEQRLVTLEEKQKHEQQTS